MRTIKFRAWDKERKEMLIGAGYSTGQLNNVTLNELEFPEDKVFMQFTGLFDKKGEEIYEGDIIVFEEQQVYQFGTSDKRIIEWQNGNFDWVDSITKESVSGWTYGVRTSKYSIIIGNIYQNPELIN